MESGDVMEVPDIQGHTASRSRVLAGASEADIHTPAAVVAVGHIHSHTQGDTDKAEAVEHSHMRAVASVGVGMPLAEVAEHTPVVEANSSAIPMSSADSRDDAFL